MDIGVTPSPAKVCGLSENDLVWKYHGMTKLSSCRTPGDELAKNWNGKTRAKSIHPVGVVGKVQWKNLGGHRYSGIFKGAKHGLARWYLKAIHSAIPPYTLQALSSLGARHGNNDDCARNGPQVLERQSGFCEPRGHVLCWRTAVVELFQERLFKPHSGVRILLMLNSSLEENLG